MSTRETVYGRLPAYIRSRDAETGEPLRALLLVLESELDLLDQAIEQQYENLFVETCEDWAAPYIGDLVRAPRVRGVSGQGVTPRAVVANTLAYRRRKGTVGVLEALLDDTADWEGKAVEMRHQLAWTQHASYPNPNQPGTQNVRSADQLARIGGPFQTTARWVDVRTARRGGLVGLSRLGLFAWREEPALRSEVDAAAAPGGSGRFTFDPRGRTCPLYNRPGVERGLDETTTESNLPIQLRRRLLHDDLLLDEEARSYLGQNPVLSLVLGVGTDVSTDDMVIANLANWWAPPTGKVAVDPVLGRICFPAGQAPETLTASFRSGSVLQIGAHPRDRNDDIESAWSTAVWQRGVTRDPAYEGVDNIVASLAEAITEWNADHDADSVGIITILDSRTYVASGGAFPTIELRSGARLLIVAAAWPSADGTPAGTREVGVIDASERQPLLDGDLKVEADAGGGTELCLDGLDVRGHVEVLPGHLEILTVRSCTLLHGVVDGFGLVLGGDGVDGWNAGLEVSVSRSVVEGLSATARESVLTATDSALLAGPTPPEDPPAPLPGLGIAIDALVADVTLVGCTVVGDSTVKTLTATNAILGDLSVERTQSGRLSHCYVPPTARTPSRFRCLPDASTADETDSSAVARARIRSGPVFQSVSPVHPRFMVLDDRCAGLRSGATDGGEIGVTHHLGQQIRRRNIELAMDEFAPLGADIILTFVNGEYTP